MFLNEAVKYQYVMSLNQNYALTQDSALTNQYGNMNYSYYDTRMDYTYITEPDGESLMVIWITQDD
jgi:hypothetical protein